MRNTTAWIAALVMIVSLLAQPLPAKERRGATVEVTMTDGSKVRGELLAVKVDALLIYDRDSGQGRSIDLQQVNHVTLLRKLKFLTGIAIGLGVGLVVGANPEKNVHIDNYWLRTCYTFAVIGGLLNGAVTINAEKIITLAGVSPQTWQKKLEWLEHYAREQDSEKPAALY